MDVLHGLLMGALGGLVGTTIVCVPYYLYLRRESRRRR